jgi:hypothetical protein
MGTGDAAHATWSDRVVEWLAEQCLADVRLGFVARAEISDTEACRRFLARKMGSNGCGDGRVRIEGHAGSLGEGVPGAVRVRSIFHQAL